MKLRYRHVRFTNEDSPMWRDCYTCIGVSGPDESVVLGYVSWDYRHRWRFYPEKFIELTIQQLADIQQFMRLLSKLKVEA